MAQIPHSIVEVRIRCPGDYTDRIRQRCSAFLPDRGDMVYSSPLPPRSSIDEHLKLFHTILQHHSKFFRQLNAAGITTVISIKVNRPLVSIEPEALLLAHKLHAKTEIRFSK